MKSVVVGISLLFAIIISGAVLTNAQSGRRGAVRPTPTPFPEATPTPTPKPQAKPERKPVARLRMVSDITALSSPMFIRGEESLNWIGERLRGQTLLELGGVKEGSNKDAKQIAAASEDEHVLFVRLSDMTMGSPSASASDISLNFTLYEPKTGKSKLNGAAYLRPELLSNNAAYNYRRMCAPGLRDLEFLLRMASFEVAERILGSFGMPVPREECNSRIGF